MFEFLGFKLFQREEQPNEVTPNSASERLRDPQGTVPSTPETTQSPEQTAVKKHFQEKYITPLKTFLADISTEAGDALSQLKEAASTMSFSNDVWEVYQAEQEGKKVDHIGGIPLPKEYPPIQKKRADVLITSHRGFGERNLAQYDQNKEGMQNVENTLTGLELAVRSGANMIEVDLVRTKDGKYVLHHLMPGKKELGQSASEYLAKNPESLTLSELAEWLAHQPDEVQLYVELKSEIGLEAFLEQIQQHDINNTLSERLCLYGGEKTRQKILMEKRRLGIPTNQLKVFYLTNGLLSAETIDTILEEDKQRLEADSDGNGLSAADCTIYGVEQGMVPLGWFGENMPTALKVAAALLRKSDIAKTIEHAHQKGLKFITGTVDHPAMINFFMELGVDGLVPNNVVDFEMANIQFDQPAAQVVGYIPETMKARLEQTGQEAETRRTEQTEKKIARAERWKKRQKAIKQLLSGLDVPTSKAA